MRWRAQHLDPIESCRAGLGLIEATQAVEQAGLASPVRADQTGDSALRHGEADIIQSMQATEGQGEAANIQQISHVSAS